MKKKILVHGPALSRSGYGEQTRFAIRALRAHEDKFDIYLSNINWGATGWLYEDNEERQWMDQALIKSQHYMMEKKPFDISLQVTIPNEWERYAPVNIGYTAGIETTKISPKWLEKTPVVDKMIVVSEHAKYGFDNTAYQTKDANGNVGSIKNTTPVDVVGYPVRDFEPEPLDLNLTTDFNFLAVAQWGPRKNLDNTILWFVEEFLDNENVGLVVKATIKSGCTMDRFWAKKRIENTLAKYPERKCKVYLLHGDMTDGEMTSLYRHPKIKSLVTLTHGEGYGLPIFEAAYNSLPIIAPNWSGQVDYLSMPIKSKGKKKRNTSMFSKVDYDIRPVQKEAVWKGVLEADSMWCFPTQGSYKIKLRDMYKNHKDHLSRARKLEKHIRTKHAPQVLYDQFVDSILKALPESQVTNVVDGELVVL